MSYYYSFMQKCAPLFQENSRDSERNPMQWDTSQHAGFTNGTPWLPVNPDYMNYNVKVWFSNVKSVFRDQ